jgi:hypothetical protein
MLLCTYIQYGLSSSHILYAVYPTTPCRIVSRLYLGNAITLHIHIQHTSEVLGNASCPGCRSCQSFLQCLFPTPFPLLGSSRARAWELRLHQGTSTGTCTGYVCTEVLLLHDVLPQPHSTSPSLALLSLCKLKLKLKLEIIIGTTVQYEPSLSLHSSNSTLKTSASGKCD